jgi:hypothetical protein
MTITNAHFATTSSHLFANCMFIFHKTEVQTVILRCLTGLNLDWFKSYDLRFRWRPRTCLAYCQKIATDKWLFCYNIWPFFCQLYVYLSQNLASDGHFRCLTSLNLIWYNSYDTKCKNTKNTNKCFCTKLKKKWKWKYLYFVS